MGLAWSLVPGRKPLPYFAEHGYRSHALDLRGHGKSEGADRLRWTGIRQYVSDVGQVVERCEESPILNGHSMGSLVVQKYLESDPKIPAAVLLALVHPGGVIRTTLSIAARASHRLPKGQCDSETISNSGDTGTHARGIYLGRRARSKGQMLSPAHSKMSHTELPGHDAFQSSPSEPSENAYARCGCC
ncbi:MAG TPA: alpha/beta fold hydrolase [Ktedonobacteraceae bacterium]|nr:alpha/beta fold hydrolase [Ktedonobacteraceae bacterium]